MARRPLAELRVSWSKRENALLYHGSSPTGGMLSGIFERITLGEMNGDMCGTECKRNGIKARLREGRTRDASDLRSLVKELDERGYDVTTLKFSIRKKVPTP